MRQARFWMLGGLALAAAAWARAAGSFVSAADARFRYEGRIDFSDRTSPVLIWEGSQVAVDFSGSAVEVRFGAATGQNYFDAVVDGTKTVLAVPEGPRRSLTVPAGAASTGRHHLVLFKRSEATAGTAHFEGVELASGGEAWRPVRPHYRLRLEFLGDCITAGACDEDGPADQWTDRSTHDFAFSYAELTAQALHAELHCEAVSGMGIELDWAAPLRVGEVWDRLYPDSHSPRADLADWQPDLVCINFGENDGSYPAAHGQPFPAAAFTPGYVAFVRAVRAAYPRAQIVLLRGGMSNGATNPALRDAWIKAVRTLEASDPKITPFVFKHWSVNHPRVADHRAMADELIAWLKARPALSAREGGAGPRP